MSDKSLSIAVLLAAIAFAIVPFFSNFSGYGPDAFPIPQINPPAQPAGYAFAIWGVTYLWLVFSAVIGFANHSADPTWRPARLVLLASLIIGAIWLPIAETNAILATVLIWAMLITALLALARAPDTTRWVFKASIALYAGWLAAASCVSIALVGAGYGLLFDAHTWAMIIVLTATAISCVVLLRLHAIPEFGVAVTWALIAVVAKDGLSSPSAWLAAACALITAVLTLRQIFAMRRLGQ
ncbi:MAG: hypothetical protein ABJF50_13560 [Paracoccaceae bacterium]